MLEKRIAYYIGVSLLAMTVTLSGCATQSHNQSMTKVGQLTKSNQKIEPTNKITLCEDGFCPLTQLKSKDNKDHTEIQTSRYTTMKVGVNNKQENPLFAVSNYHFASATRTILQAINQVLLNSGYHLDSRQAQGVLPLLNSPLAVNQYQLKSVTTVDALQTLLGSEVTIASNPITKAIRLSLTKAYLSSTNLDNSTANTLVPIKVSNGVVKAEKVGLASDQTNKSSGSIRQALPALKLSNSASKINSNTQRLAHYHLVLSPFVSVNQRKVILADYRSLGLTMGFIKAVKAQNLVSYRDDNNNKLGVAKSLKNAKLVTQDNVFYVHKGQSLSEVLKHWRKVTHVTFKTSDIPTSILNAKINKNLILKGAINATNDQNNIVNQLIQLIFKGAT